MCDAVVPDPRPENEAETNIVFAVVSMTTVAKPVPPEPVGGTSAEPVSGAWYVITLPNAAGVSKIAKVSAARRVLIL
jgi:hypothetical protein